MGSEVSTSAMEVTSENHNPVPVQNTDQTMYIEVILV